METSLSVRNDAILNKAKWWILSSLIGSFVMWIIRRLWDYLLVFNYSLEAMDSLEIRDNVLEAMDILLWPILFIVGCVILLKHSVSSIRIFAKMLIIYQSILILAIILDNYGWAILLNQIYESWAIHAAWSRVLWYVERIIAYFFFFMGLAALWKNKQIKKQYTTIIPIFAMVMFLYYVCFLSSNMWQMRGCFENPMLSPSEFYATLEGRISSMLAGIFRFISPIIQLLPIYCYCKLLKTPSLMPTEDNPDELPYSYRPTKIEIGFVICVALFIGCIFLTFLFV